MCPGIILPTNATETNTSLQSHYPGNRRSSLDHIHGSFVGGNLVVAVEPEERTAATIMQSLAESLAYEQSR